MERQFVRNRRSAGHVGRHRAPTAPRAGYAAVVTTAVVGAGVAALAVGSALPTPQTAHTSTALEEAAEFPNSASAALTAPGKQETRTLSDSRASRAQRRTGVGVPERLPEWIKPAVGQISSLYAARWGTFHYGIDIAAAYGSTVRAASEGKVIRADWYGGYGQIVIIDHGDGVTTRYGHNSSLLVSVGDWVEAGDPIAKVGSTGASTGPHCHFEVRIDDEPTDPLAWLQKHSVTVNGINTNL